MFFYSTRSATIPWKNRLLLKNFILDNRYLVATKFPQVSERNGNSQSFSPTRDYEFEENSDEEELLILTES